MMNYRRRSIELPAPGVLLFRENGKELQFPVFQEDGWTVFVAYPSLQRQYPTISRRGAASVPPELSDCDRERIASYVIDYLNQRGRLVRVMLRHDEKTSEFHPELLECRSKAAELLDLADCVMFRDYASIDLLPQECGLEICGITQERLHDIVSALGTGFPHWHFRGHCREDEEGMWKFAIHMFARRQEHCGLEAD